MYPESSRNFEANRVLAGVGAILAGIGSLLVFRGVVGIGVLGIFGLILVLVAAKGLADDYKNHAIYRPAMIAFTLGLIGTLIGIAVFAAFDFLSGFIFSHPIVGAFGIIFAIGGWIVMFLFFLLEGIFFKNAFDNLASSSKEKVLRTGGLLILIGGALTIIVVGFFILFVGWLVVAAGMFSLKPPMQPIETFTAPPPPPNAGTVSGQMKYCSYCGAENKLDGTFCTHCGRRLNAAQV
jgi:uncharacterized membrane protein